MRGRRLVRVSHSIRSVLAELLLTEIRDPRILAGGVVSITDVEVSADLGVAKVWVSVSVTDAQVRARVLEGFDQASRFLRGELGRRLRLKKTPALRFFVDETEDRAWRIETLLREEAAARGDDPESVPDPSDGQGDDTNGS